MFYVDQFAYHSRLRKLHPMEKFLFTLITLGICLAEKNPLVHLMIILIMLGLLKFKAGIPGRILMRLISLPMAFLIIGVVTIAISFSGVSDGMAAWVKLGGYYFGVSQSGLRAAGLVFFQSLSSVTCLYFLALTMPMVELIYVLRLCKIPVVVTELMIIIYRFIFVFIETAFHIYTAQSSRWGYYSFKRSVNSFGVLIANLWGKAFYKSQAIFRSLISRGYEKEIRVLDPQYHFSFAGIMSFFAIDLILVIVSYTI